MLNLKYNWYIQHNNMSTIVMKINLIVSEEKNFEKSFEG